MPGRFITIAVISKGCLAARPHVQGGDGGIGGNVMISPSGSSYSSCMVMTRAAQPVQPADAKNFSSRARRFLNRLFMPLSFRAKFQRSEALFQFDHFAQVDAKLQQ